MLKAIDVLRDKYTLRLTLVGEKADENYFREIIDYINAQKLSEIVEIKLALKGFRPKWNVGIFGVGSKFGH